METSLQTDRQRSGVEQDVRERAGVIRREIKRSVLDSAGAAGIVRANFPRDRLY